MSRETTCNVEKPELSLAVARRKVDLYATRLALVLLDVGEASGLDCRTCDLLRRPTFANRPSLETLVCVSWSCHGRKADLERGGNVI
jgi:hypothetical protein